MDGRTSICCAYAFSIALLSHKVTEKHSKVWIDTAVYLNGDWDDFQRFRRHQAHLKRYGASHPHAVPEDLMLGVAA